MVKKYPGHQEGVDAFMISGSQIVEVKTLTLILQTHAHKR